jgi:hypothetical protein
MPEDTTALLVAVRAYQATTTKSKARQPALHTRLHFQIYIQLRVRLRIMNRLADFSAIATANAARLTTFAHDMPN